MDQSIATKLCGLLLVGLLVAFWKPLGLFLMALGLGGASIGIAVAVLAMGAGLTIAVIQARL